MRLGGWVKLGAVAVLVVVGGSLAYGWTQGNHAARLDAKLARQRSEALAEKARADKWTVTWAEAAPHLLADAAEKDTIIARLRENVRLAGAHTVARTVVQTTTRVDTVLVADTVREPGDGWTRRWTIDQHPAYGAAWYVPPDSLGLDLLFRPRIELLAHMTADGRLMLNARSPDPGVEIQVETLEWDPPEPEGLGFPWLCAGAAFGSGGVVALKPEWWTAGAGALATLLAC